MSGYLPQIRYETEYEGDKIAIEMTALTRKAFIKVMPSLDGAKQIAATASQKMAVYDVACDVLNDHVTEISGLRDKNGHAVSKEAMLSSVYFIDLVTGAFNKLVNECSLGKLKSADSEGKLPENTEAPAPTTSH